MTIKDVLVTLDTGGTSERRLTYAVEFARAHGAHLIGLYVLEPLDLAGYFSPAISGYLASDAMQQIESRHREAAASLAKKVEAVFRQTCAQAAVAHEWRQVEGDPLDLAVLNARYADIAIAGQIDPQNPPLGSAARVPEQIALATGRPVLIVPYAGRYESVARNIVVAWNRTREATRALHDALPILRHAKQVTVLSINPQRSGGTHDLPGADISLHLARHGVKAEASYTVADDIDVGSILLSRAADLGADLIVMGCYGHSRTRELILGGATRQLLRHMTVPVLMSH